MRLLVLNYEYPPLGGDSGIITQNISKRLAKRGHHITVITTWVNEEPEDKTEGTLRLIRLKSKRKNTHLSNPSEMISWIFKSKKFLKKHLKTEKYDLCIASFALPSGEVAYSMKLLFKLPYVIISHGYDIPWCYPEKMMWYHAITYQWIHKICLQSEINFAQTKNMKDNIDSFLGIKFSEKNKIINIGWNRDIFFPNYKNRNKNFTIIFTDNIINQKYLITFLKAIILIKDKIPDLKVNILGYLKIRKKITNFLFANELNDIINFKLCIDKNERLYEYQKASLTIISSSYDNITKIHLDVLASGQYLLNSMLNNDENLVIQDYNSNIIKNDDASDLAEKILSFYNTKFLNNYLISEVELEKYNNIFDWNKIVDEYEDEFDKISFRTNFIRKLN